MSVNSGFFDSVNGDRVYSADVMSQPYASLISDGVIPNKGNKLQVVADSGMNVKVKSGFAFVGGKWIENDADLTIALTSTTLPRIASIVLKMDKTSAVRACSIYAKYGTASASPVAPVLVNTTSLKEMALANIYIGAAATAISQANITDKRGSSDCPWCGTLIQDIDVSTLYAQYQAQGAEGAQTLNAYFTEKKNEIDALLSTSAATSLQNQIDAEETARADADTALSSRVTVCEGWVYHNTTAQTISAEGVGNYNISVPSGYKGNSVIAGITFKIGTLWHEMNYCGFFECASAWDNSFNLFHLSLQSLLSSPITISEIKVLFRKLS